MKAGKRKCGSLNTATGKPCLNLADSCPYPLHRQSARRVPTSIPAHPIDLVSEAAPHSASDRRPVLPGIVTGACGFAGKHYEFAEIAHKTAAALGMESEEVVRDYWLTACLYGIAASETGGMATKGDTGEVVARYAFAGGTSLVSAWNIAERYSEDLDLLALALRPLSRREEKRAFSLPSRWAATAIGAPDGAVQVKHMGDVGFRRVYMDVGGEISFLKIETTLEPADDAIWETCEVSSLMGRFATPEQLAEHPELGGFEMTCVVPGYTAANKFDSLHRRAATRDFRGLMMRGRDLYDLACIAASEHAEAASSLVPALSERASRSPGRREDVPRPRGGYASSPAFDLETEACSALESGYETIAESLVWGHAPPFEDAVALARQLDSAA